GPCPGRGRMRSAPNAPPLRGRSPVRSTDASCASSLPGFATLRSSGRAPPVVPAGAGPADAVTGVGVAGDVLVVVVVPVAVVAGLVTSDEAATCALARAAHDASPRQASRAAP